MTTNSLEERRRYVEEVKASFQNPSKSARYRDVGADSDTSQETDVFSGAGGAWKWRLVVALILFGGFIYLAQSRITVGDVTAQQVADYLSEDLKLEELVGELSGGLQKQSKENVP